VSCLLVVQVSREQKMDQDRLDNETRQKSDYDAHIKQKENELEESIQRLDKLNEYIKYGPIISPPCICLSVCPSVPFAVWWHCFQESCYCLID